MIIIGDKLIPYEDIFKVNDIQEISNTKANSTLLFSYDIDLIKYCHKNSIPFFVKVKDIKELIYASQFNTKYIICDKTFVKDAQKIAENYMFDSKILTIINSDDEIVWCAQNEIDGVIYNNLI